MAQSGYTSSTVAGIGLFAVLYQDFNTATGTGTKLGVSRGGLQFDPGHTLRNLPYDGKMANIVGLDRVTFRNPTISGTLLEMPSAFVMMLDPGGVTPVTMTDSGVFLTAATHYIENCAVAFERSDGSVFGYNFEDAIVASYKVISKDSEGETECSIVIEARMEHGTTPDDGTPPFAIFEVAA